MMIHTKLLLRRLAYVPWLLAAGLALVELTATPVAALELTATPSSVREDAGPTEVELVVTLAEARATDETVRFTIGAPSEGQDAVRDVDYALSFTGSVVFIPAGETIGKTTLTLYPVNNISEDGLRVIAVYATFDSGATLMTDIKIVDDETTASTAITLSASPQTVSEEMEEATIRVTATLNGGALSSDVTVNLSIDPASTAEEDEDYEWDIDDPLVIRAGSTSGSTEVFLELEDDGESEGRETIILNGSAGGGSTVSSVEITLTDQSGQVVLPPTSSTSITLSASPQTISEEDGETTVTVTATLDGKALSDNTYVVVVINSTSTADRDVDYVTEAFSPLIDIPAGSTVGSMQFKIHPYPDSEVEGNETIKLIAVIDELIADEVEITLTDPVTGPSKLDDSSFAFVATVEDQTYTAGTAIPPLVLPPAEGGTGTITYVLSLSSSLSGLSFDPATRTLSGTPSAATTSPALGLYAALGEDKSISLLFYITVNEPQLSSLGFATYAVDDQEYTVGEAITDLVLPEATGGTGTLTYLVFGLPAGLVFDAATRTISGTPTAATDGALDVLYTVIDGDAKSAVLRFTITVNDESDETASTSITLSASPSRVSEEMEEATITVTATLNSGTLSSNVTVNLSIDPASTAEEDWDYELDIDDPLVIRAGSTSGSTEVFLELEDDGESESSETIRLNGSAGGGLTVGWVEITLTDQTTEPTDTGDSPLAFVSSVDDQTYTVGTAITELELPEATGGTGALAYVVSSLPAGLSFDWATRILSGTPTAATNGAFPVLYTVVDGDGKSATLNFTITVNKKLTFDLSDLFGAGKVVPTAADGATLREFVVGQHVDGLVLPEALGGSAPLTYSLSPALPAGLTFDPATRTILGTPQAASEAVYTYTVTDANGATASLALQVLPAACSLADNFPNPFNPATTIQYALPIATDVELTVYNVVGQPVRTLVAEHQSAGRYTVEWDATDDSGHSVSAGLYFYRLQVGGEFAEVKKMLLLK